MSFVRDPQSDLARNADQLIDSCYDLIFALMQHREGAGLTHADVEARIGYDVPFSVDMSLMELRRYALALGVTIEFTVKPFNPNPTKGEIL